MLQHPTGQNNLKYLICLIKILTGRSSASQFRWTDVVSDCSDLSSSKYIFLDILYILISMKIDCVDWTNLKFKILNFQTVKFKVRGQEEKQEEKVKTSTHLKSQMSLIFTKNKDFVEKYTSRNRPVAHQVREQSWRDANYSGLRAKKQNKTFAIRQGSAHTQGGLVVLGQDNAFLRGASFSFLSAGLMGLLTWCFAMRRLLGQTFIGGPAEPAVRAVQFRRCVHRAARPFQRRGRSTAVHLGCRVLLFENFLWTIWGGQRGPHRDNIRQELRRGTESCFIQPKCLLQSCGSFSEWGGSSHCITPLK